jgi:tetratricopeptide (TPR) repeat protein
MKRRKHRRPRGIIGWLVVLALLATSIYGGLYSAAWYTQNRVQRALTEHDPEAVDRWIKRARWFPMRRARTHFLEARLARRQRNPVRMGEYLQKAATLGYDPELLAREHWLARAEIGDMELLTNQMAMMLTDPRGDGLEIVESYVKGLVHVGRYQAAVEMLEAWCKDYPDGIFPRQLLGSVLIDMDRWEEAGRVFRDVLRQEPENEQAAFGLGIVLMTQQKTSSALPYLQAAARDEKLYADAMIRQARCHRALAEPRQARQVLEELVEQLADRAAIVELARLNLDEGQFEQAVGRVEPLVNEDPRQVGARYVYAQALRQLGRQEEAEGHFSAVMEINKNLALANELAERLGEGAGSVDRRVQIAQLQFQYGSEKEGLRWLVEALRVDDMHRPALEALGRYYARKAEQYPGDQDARRRRDDFQQRLKQLSP